MGIYNETMTEEGKVALEYQALSRKLHFCEGATGKDEGTKVGNKRCPKGHGRLIKINFTFFKFLLEAILEVFKRPQKTLFSVSSDDTDGSPCPRHSTGV